MAGFNPGSDYHLVPNQTQQLDLLGQEDMSTGLDPQKFMQDLLNARGDQYAPWVPPEPPIDQHNEYQDEPYQVAGDVVPTSRYADPSQSLDALRRLSNVGTTRGSMGQLSIDSMGGTKNPYIDLLNILMYPQGGQIRK